MENISTLGWFYIETVVVAFVVILFLFYFLLKKSSEVKKLSIQLRSLKKDNIKDFLDREIKISNKALISKRQQKENSPSTLRALSLRKNLLFIELECLDDGGVNPSNIDKILEKLIAYFKISPWLRSKVDAADVDETIQKSMLAVEKNKSHLSELVDVQRETIIELREKLNVAGCAISEIEKIDEIAESESIEDLKKALDVGKKEYQDLRQQFEILTLKNGEKNKIEGKVDANIIADKTLDEVSSKYEIALNELENIRQINNKKRNYLEVIEAEYENNKGSNLINENDIPETIEKLKLQLRDSEMCTAVLESEAESLRDEIARLRQQQNTWKEINENSEKSGAMEESKSSKNFLALVLDATGKILTSENSNIIEEVISNFSNEIKAKLSVTISASGVEHWFSNSGEVSDEVKEAIREVGHIKNGQWTSHSLGNIFILDNIGCLISTEFDQDLHRLSDLLMVASNRLDSISQINRVESQKINLSKLVKKSGDAIKVMESNNKKLSADGKKAFNAFVKEVTMFLDSLGLTERQQGLFAQIEEELYAEMNSIFEKRSSIDDSFKKLAELLKEEYVE